MPLEYQRIRAGPAAEFGSDAGTGSVVDALRAGGRPPAPVGMPPPGWHATCAEPGAQRFGHPEGDPGAR